MNKTTTDEAHVKNMQHCDKCDRYSTLVHVKLTRAEYLPQETQEKLGKNEGMVAFEVWLHCNETGCWTNDEAEEYRKKYKKEEKEQWDKHH